MTAAPNPLSRVQLGSSRATIATVRDVASLAGVSAMTVSRVINGTAPVGAEVRARVERAVVELDYKPNAVARALKGLMPIRLALLYANPSSAYISEALIGAITGAEALDVHVTLERVEHLQDGASAAVRLAGLPIDGVLVPPPLVHMTEVTAPLIAAGKVVAALSSSGDRTLFGFNIDNRNAARMMTHYLLSLGHRRIGIIVGDPRHADSLLRLEGYREALAEHGQPYDASVIAHGDFTFRSGLAAASELLNLAERPTAIFASNDDMAAAAMSIAHRYHLDVPGDLSIAGFDDSTIATTLSPELTTIRQPVALMASAAIRTLAQVVRNKRKGISDAITTADFPIDLVVRESTAAMR